MVKSCASEKFVDEVTKMALDIPKGLFQSIVPILNAIDSLSLQIEACDDELKKSVEKEPISKLLMTTPGVGPIVAMYFLTVIREPSRFKTGRSLGAYLGLVPSLYQSGKTNRKGRITKHGNRQLRWALTVAANALLRSKTASALKTWGVKLVEKIGRKKAIVALARKLASVLLAMWKSNRPFESRC
jgi:transposase